MQSILVDAGPVIALFRAKDPHHELARRFVIGNSLPLVTTWPVITEVCHFLNGKGKSNLLTWIRRGGLQLHALSDNDVAGLQGLIEQYGDRMDLADASLVWLGEKLRITDIITIDHSDFSTYRTVGGKPFRNLLAA